MTAADIGTYAGALFVAWCTGFSIGWSITQFRSAMTHI